ncbi:MAG: LacI family transcriptional regulator [Clostridiales bacterium]|nr:LacI family transcriptional regulator [Clostridiales bacterium]
MPKTVIMADIAAKIGVSTVTVSKALAGKEGVSEEIRAKIKQVADEMGYRAGLSARKLSKSTGNIGILIPSYFMKRNNSFYWVMYERVIGRLSASGYYGILEMVRQEDEDSMASPRMMLDGKIDGLIVIGQLKSAYREFLYANGKIPVMFLDSYNSVGSDCIISDGYYGMYTVTNYLISLGHSDIRFVGSVDSTSSIRDRYFGFCRAMQEHGFAFGREMIVPDRDEKGVLNVVLPKKLPTAFACNCDLAACDVINKLKDRGLCVPEDMSVAGFDDYVFSTPSNASITTYAVDMDGMARACVESLIRKIHNPHYAPNLKIISGRLVVRESARKIN